MVLRGDGSKERTPAGYLAGLNKTLGDDETNRKARVHI